MTTYTLQTWSVPQSKWIDQIEVNTSDIQNILQQSESFQITSMANGTRWRIISKIPICAENIK